MVGLIWSLVSGVIGLIILAFSTLFLMAILMLGFYLMKSLYGKYKSGELKKMFDDIEKGLKDDEDIHDN